MAKLCEGLVLQNIKYTTLPKIRSEHRTEVKAEKKNFSTASLLYKVGMKRNRVLLCPVPEKLIAKKTKEKYGDN